MNKIFSLLFLLNVFCVTSQNSYLASNIPATLSDNANSVIQEERILIDITENDKLIYTKYQAITVLNERGNRHIDDEISYDDDKRVKDAEVWIYGADGTELKHFQKRDFLEASAYDGISIFSDNRVLYLNYTPTEYPYTFVIETTTQSRTTAFIPRWFPIDNYKKAIMSSELVLKYNENNKTRMRTSNLEGFDIQITDGPQSIQCKASNLQAIEYEDHSPSFTKIAPHVAFALDMFYLKGVQASATNWKEFGAWMNSSLLDDTRQLPEETIAMVKQLVASEKTDIAKARKVYEFLQNKVRYISVQVGIGGWKPMLATDVDKLGYGDCKALTNYTKALLDALEIPSYYTVLYAGGDENDIISDFSSMQGNHVLLGLPSENGIIWLECTSQDVPFGYNGNFSDDRDVLILTDNGGEIVHTKEYPYSENTLDTEVTASIDETGKLLAGVEIFAQGLQYDTKFRLELLDTKDLDKRYKERWSYLNGLVVDEVNFDNNKEEIRFAEKLSITVQKYGTRAGEDLLVPLNIVNRSEYIPPRYSNRKQDLYISEGFTHVDKVVLNIPNNLTIGSLPEPVKIENIFGSYHFTCKQITKNQLEYQREFIIKKGVFDKTEYPNYRKFRRLVTKNDKTKIILKRNNN